MQTMIFSEWSVIRSSIKQYAIVTAIMALVIGVGSVTLFDAASAEEVATHVYVAIVPTVSIMLTFFVFFSLFGADEREGWESARLALPLSRRQVVSARYRVMIVSLVVSMLMAAVSGAVAAAICAWSQFGVFSIPTFDEMFSLVTALTGIFVIYVGIEMPIFFNWGLAKARPFFNAPALLSLLLVLPLLGSLRSSIDIESMSTGSIAQQVGTTLLSTSTAPLPLVAVTVVLYLALACGLYLASMRLSQYLYVRRDF